VNIAAAPVGVAAVVVVVVVVVAAAVVADAIAAESGLHVLVDTVRSLDRQWGADGGRSDTSYASSTTA